MMTSGEMDVHRPVEFDTRLAPLRDIFGVALGIGRRKSASDIACAGDEPGTDRGSLWWSSPALRWPLRRPRPFRPARRRSEGFATPSAGYRRRRCSCAILARPRICAAVSRATGSTTPIQLRPACFCGCTPIWARAVKGGPRQDRFRRHLCQFAAKLLLDTSDVFFDAPGIEHVFEARLVAIGAIAVLDVDADNRIGDLRRFFRL